MRPPPALSVMLPCLNEEESLPDCISGVRKALEGSEFPLGWEIIVADNGSSDRSVRIAEEMGVLVVKVADRGYGRALSAGIQAAASPYVVFVDADDTYPLELISVLYRQTLKTGAVLGLASRLGGKIEAGAMPWLHRWIGTPFFTKLINLLYGGTTTDCGSGFRCVRRDWFLANPHHSTGMEFASENLIRAYKSNGTVIEIRGGLNRSPAGRHPHLRTWRDGMRHLMFILAECPPLFEKTGLAICAGASVLQAIAAWHGPWKAGVFDILGLHTQLLALLAAVLGTQLYFMGVLLHERAGGKPTRFTGILLGLPEDRLFFAILGSCGLGFIVAVIMTVAWSEGHFSGLSAERSLLGAVHLVLLLGAFSLGFFGVHMTKTWKSHS